MTAFVALVTPEQSFLAIDALASDVLHKTPRNLVTKVFLLPSMRLVMFGTGLLDFLLDWSRLLQHRFVLADVEVVDNYATEALRERWGPYNTIGEPTTIYHIGYTHGQFRWYTYRSDNQFSSQALPHALVVHPVEGVPKRQLDGQPLAGTPTLDAVVKDFVEIMEMQKRYDDAQPQDQRLGIGGEIYFLVMLPPAEYRLFVCHQFSDAMAMCQQIQGGVVQVQAS